jgi:hypothetical protein
MVEYYIDERCSGSEGEEGDGNDRFIVEDELKIKKTVRECIINKRFISIYV